MIVVRPLRPVNRLFASAYLYAAAILFAAFVIWIGPGLGRPPAEGALSFLPARPVPADRAELAPSLRVALYEALSRDAGADYALNPQTACGRNPAHGWTVCWDSRGLRLRGLSGEVRLGLVAWGREGALEPVKPAAPEVVGNEVRYRRGALVEWYRNLAVGVEHGFTLFRRPAGAGPLVLVVRASQAGHEVPGGVRFGEVVYREVLVVDAAGQSVPARMVRKGREVWLVVEDAWAIYPLQVDPWVQQAKLIAADGKANDYFGGWVALSADGNTALVGAPGQEAAYVFVRSGTTWSQQAKLNAQGITAVSLSDDGNTALVGASDANVGSNVAQGAAYIFVRSGTTWSQQAKLTAADGQAEDWFGYNVALSGDGNTALVGAVFADVGGNADQGAAYVFVRSGTIWSQQAKLTVADGRAKDYFGRAVALSEDGNTALVGAYGADIGGNANQGTAYVFVRSGATWSQQAKLTASDGAADDRFGGAVALSKDGNTALVGASYVDVGGNDNQGAVYVFVRSGANWSQQAKLTAADGQAKDYFGRAVALSGDGNTALVGATLADIGGNANQGAAYIFVRSGATWRQQIRLTAPDGAENWWFGHSVAVARNGSTAIVGAPVANVGGNAGQGAVYVFVPAAHNIYLPLVVR